MEGYPEFMTAFFSCAAIATSKIFDSPDSLFRTVVVFIMLCKVMVLLRLCMKFIHVYTCIVVQICLRFEKFQTSLIFAFLCLRLW